MAQSSTGRVLEPTRGSEPPRSLCLFLTGATGFVGSHFLLARGSRPGRLVALVRGDSHDKATSRLLDALDLSARSYAQPFDRDEWHDRVEVVLGDVTQPGLGLPEPVRAALATAPPDEFWHFAAAVNFEERRFEKLRPQNIGGTRHALEVARAVGARRFLYVSTAYTAGAAAGSIEERLHPLDAGFSNAYEETKCHAEHLVARYGAEHDLDVRILRPSIVVGPADTLRFGGSSTGLYGFARTVHRLRDSLASLGRAARLTGDPSTPVNLVPVDHVVRDLLWLSERDFEGGPIYHLTADDALDAGTLTEVMCRHLGLRPFELGPPAADPSPMERLLDRLTDFYQSYLQNGKRFVRSLPTRTYVSVEDFNGYIHEYFKDLSQRSDDQVFERSSLRSSDGARISVYTGGRPDCPAVLLINAYGMTVEFWVPIALRLATSYRVLSWESRGVPGRFHHFDPDACGVPAHVEDLLAVLDRHRVDAAHLVGWCTGAQVALRAAALHPERVRSLVLLNGSFSVPASVPRTGFRDNIEYLMPKIARGRRYAQRYHDMMYGTRAQQSYRGGNEAALRRDRETLADVLLSTDELLLNLTSAPFRTPESLYRYANLRMRLTREPDHAWTEGVRAPALVISSGGDVISHPEESAWVARRLGAEHAVVEQGDHFSLYKDDELGDLVYDFLARHRTRLPAAPCGETETAGLEEGSP